MASNAEFMISNTGPNVRKTVYDIKTQNVPHNHSQLYGNEEFRMNGSVELVASRSEKKLTKTGLSLIGITGGLAVTIVVGCAPFISPALRRVCLPFIPATDIQIQNIMKALGRRKGRLLDIGSGDGRVVIAAAKQGFLADGVELNPWLVAFSKLQAIRFGVSKKTNFYHCDLWKFNLSTYQNVIIFGVEEMMAELKEKLCQELDGNAVIIACRFPLPSITPTSTYGTGIDTVWLYENWKKY